MVLASQFLKTIGYCDADYAVDLDTRYLTSDFSFILSRGCVTLSSKRQASFFFSTTKAEFVAACKASKEAVWLQKLLYDIGHQCSDPITLHINNQSAISLLKNQEFHRRSKHIDVRYEFICEILRQNIINSKYVSTNDQNADILTKAFNT